MTWQNDCTGLHCYNTAGGGGGGSNANHAVTPHLVTGKPRNVLVHMQDHVTNLVHKNSFKFKATWLFICCAHHQEKYTLHIIAEDKVSTSIIQCAIQVNAQHVTCPN